MNRYVRMTARRVAGPLAPDLVLDLLLDEKHMIVSDEVIFGFQGSVNNPSGECSPLVIYDTEKIDYGSAVDGSRYASIDLTGQPIVMNRRLNLKYGEHDYGFEVIRVRDRLE